MNETLFPIVTEHFLINPKNTEKPLTEDWIVSLKGASTGADVSADGVGSLRFENAALHGEITMDLDLAPSYEKDSFVSEIFYSMARFAFRFNSVREISTVCRHENEHRVRGLERAGYVRREFKDGCDHYSMKKQKTSWTGLYVILGMIAGFLIGILFSNLWMGTAAGVIIGTIMGILMDKREHIDER